MNHFGLKCAAMALAMVASAQAFTLTGKVSDESGKAIEKASVELLKNGLKTTTDVKGEFKLFKEELISLYGKFLCNDLKIYNVQALIQVKSEGVKNVQGDKVQSTKVIRNGQLLIERNGRTYNANGIEVK